MLLRYLVSGLATCCLASNIIAQTTWTVAPGGADFDSVQRAIDAANPGDTVLVLSGSYSGFVLDKSLKVIGVRPDGGGNNPGVGSVTIRNIESEEFVFISDVTSGNKVDAELILENCEGPLVFHNTIWTGAVLSNCSSVWFSESFISTPGTNQTVALESTDSRVLCQNTQLVGDAVGGEPIRAIRSDLVVRDGVIRVFPFVASLAGTLADHSTVLWSGGLYSSCPRVPCFATFEMDATSTSAFLPRVQTELRVNQDADRVRLMVSVPPADSLVVLAFSEVGQASSERVDGYWLDSDTLQILDARVSTSIGSNMEYEYPVVEFPVRVGVSFAVQAGILTPEGEVSFTNRGIVAF